jgi:hypothetical protein
MLISVFVGTAICALNFIMFYILKRINNSTYATHEFQYSWRVTGAMLSGVTPAVIILTLWFLMIVGIYYWLFYVIYYVLNFSTMLEIKNHEKNIVVSDLNQDQFILKKSTRSIWRKNCYILLLITICVIISYLIYGFYVYAIVSEVNITSLVFIQVTVAISKKVVQKVITNVFIEKTL